MTRSKEKRERKKQEERQKIHGMEHDGIAGTEAGVACRTTFR